VLAQKQLEEEYFLQVAAIPVVQLVQKRSQVLRAEEQIPGRVVKVTLLELATLLLELVEHSLLPLLVPHLARLLVGHSAEQFLDLLGLLGLVQSPVQLAVWSLLIPYLHFELGLFLE